MSGQADGVVRGEGAGALQPDGVRRALRVRAGWRGRGDGREAGGDARREAVGGCRGLHRAKPKFRLISADAVQGSFAAGDIEIDGASAAARFAAARIEQTATGVSLLLPSGTAIIVR